MTTSFLHALRPNSPSCFYSSPVKSASVLSKLTNRYLRPIFSVTCPFLSPFTVYFIISFLTRHGGKTLKKYNMFRTFRYPFTFPIMAYYFFILIFYQIQWKYSYSWQSRWQFYPFFVFWSSLFSESIMIKLGRDFNDCPQ